MTRPRRPSARSWRLWGNMPSRQMRVSSAPNTARTAPPARTPRTRVRPDGARPASLAAFRRLSFLSLRCAMCAPSLAQVGLRELAHEDHAELHQRAELGAQARAAGAEGRQLAREVAYADAQHAGGDHLGVR